MTKQWERKGYLEEPANTEADAILNACQKRQHLLVLKWGFHYYRKLLI